MPRESQPIEHDQCGSRFDAIQARADAATDGPWEVNGVDERWAAISSGPDSVIHAYTEHASDCVGCTCERDADVAISAEDAAFIAAARSDVPVLVSALRDRDAALRAVLALHTPETPRRDPDFHHTDRVCTECGDPFPCRTYTAVTAHIDATPKENPS